MSKKKIRALVRNHLQGKFIGGRIYIDREELEQLLADPDRDHLHLD